MAETDVVVVGAGARANAPDAQVTARAVGRRFAVFAGSDHRVDGLHPTGPVYTSLVVSWCRRWPMRNVTFSADAQLIDAARERAQRERTTLNEQFRLWLEHYAARDERARAAMQVVADLRRTTRTGGRRFTRDEANER